MHDAESHITLDSFTEHIKVMSSDKFGGRAPSSPGEQMTMDYMVEHFRAAGAGPGNGDSFFQEVSLVRMTTEVPTVLKLKGKGGTVSLNHGDDYVGVSRRMVDDISIENSELVFAGYGIVAPEYGWNDYAGLDVKGKTVVVMVNDPGYASGDEALFTGKAMTYYGRWTYKYEEAARQGADGILVIHETGPAGYPWAVVFNGWTGEQFYMEAADQNMSRCKLEGWISASAARSIFGAAGLDYADLTQKAGETGFTFMPLNLSYSAELSNSKETSVSNNIIGMVKGSDRADECIIYTAHWDHLGMRSGEEGDQIYNGARDNATGTAALLELAKAFSSLPEPPRRSILFIAVTAEEQGLLGSAYYAANPIFPLNKSVAVLNMDALNIFGPMKDITIIGMGNSQLDNYIEAAAREQGRYLRPDPEPEKGGFFRSDHFSFSKQGVPSMYTKMGVDHIENGSEWAIEQVNNWTRLHYHKASDEYDESWDLRGALDDIKLLFNIGLTLGQSEDFPEWNEGSAFKATRDAQMRL